MKRDPDMIGEKNIQSEHINKRIPFIVSKMDIVNNTFLAFALEKRVHYEFNTRLTVNKLREIIHFETSFP